MLNPTRVYRDLQHGTTLTVGTYLLPIPVILASNTLSWIAFERSAYVVAAKEIDGRGLETFVSLISLLIVLTSIQL